MVNGCYNKKITAKKRKLKSNSCSDDQFANEIDADSEPQEKDVDVKHVSKFKNSVMNLDCIANYTAVITYKQRQVAYQ